MSKREEVFSDPHDMLSQEALLGAGYRRRKLFAEPERDPAQASSRDWANGDYRSFADEPRLERADLCPHK
ncbi:hypothetical protein [Dictyobacter formicarum]|uniref:Uncharacterized protein n=1 Tax=Dictyobacter formicarum TaxID=2778368 RepID=A0ABQ3V8C7_9CHLR|nr:hypothetical protein [Dictyobacter formicarum]GHO82214.1 hypothetical protein KSZ_02200 [Dictyobacter formicarum]